MRGADSPVLSATDIDGEAAPPAGPEADELERVAESIRAVQGRQYDDLVDVSALAHPAHPLATAAGAGGGDGGVRGDGGGGGAVSLMVGSDLLRLPRLHSLLERKGVWLVETSAHLPTIMLDHDKGLLAVDASRGLQPAAVASLVSRCERSHRTSDTSAREYSACRT